MSFCVIKRCVEVVDTRGNESASKYCNSITGRYSRLWAGVKNQEHLTLFPLPSSRGAETSFFRPTDFSILRMPSSYVSVYEGKSF